MISQETTKTTNLIPAADVIAESPKNMPMLGDAMDSPDSEDLAHVSQRRPSEVALCA
jgi:hypothetical protein